MSKLKKGRIKGNPRDCGESLIGSFWLENGQVVLPRRKAAPGASVTEREPWVTGDHTWTDTRPIPTPPLRLPHRLDIPPPTSSLAQPASPTTDHQPPPGPRERTPTLCALSAGALQAPRAAFNSGLSPWVASGHRAGRAGRVPATP